MVSPVTPALWWRRVWRTRGCPSATWHIESVPSNEEQARRPWSLCANLTIVTLSVCWLKEKGGWYLASFKKCKNYYLLVLLEWYQNVMPISYQKEHMNTGTLTAAKNNRRNLESDSYLVKNMVDSWESIILSNRFTPNNGLWCFGTLCWHNGSWLGRPMGSLYALSSSLWHR